MVEVSKKRILVFDFIRLFAIVMVVLSHTLAVGDTSFHRNYLGVLGNALFFFISGYLIYLNNSSICTKKDILYFYKKRMLRIYPLYIVAILSILCINVLVFGSIGNYSVIDIVANISGISMILFPVFVSDNLLWFVGAILVFYLFYPILILLSKQSVVRYFIYSCVVVMGLLALKLTTGLIGYSLFTYYFIFVFGVCFAWIKFFSNYLNRFISALSIIIFGICFILTQTFDLTPVGTIGFSLGGIVAIFVHGLSFIFIMIYGISAIFSLYTIFNWIKLGKLFSMIIVNGAFAAYAVYLFHGQFFTIVNNLLLENGTIIAEIFSNPLIYDVVLFFILIPVIFVIGYFLQKGENICMNKLRGKTRQ